MPRPLRLEYANAFYHVMNRGRGRQAIFHGQEYCEAFLACLSEAHKRFQAEFHAYCLMGNHYHLLLKTPEGNLSRIMQHVNGLYTQRYNRLKRTDGPLFRGRYKALIVDADSYLLQVGRYIHRNPIETTKPLVEELERYPWSSYLAYTGHVASPPWLYTDLTHRMIGRKQRYAGYRSYVEQGLDDETLAFYTKGNQSSVIGAPAFRESLLEEFDERQRQVSRAIRGKPDIDSVVGAVANAFEVESWQIMTRQTGRQASNSPRKVAMYLGQQFGYSLRELRDTFALGHVGSVSNAIADIKTRISHDRDFANLVQGIGRVI